MLNLLFPSLVCDLCLLNTRGCQVCVEPGYVGVAGLEGVVALSTKLSLVIRGWELGYGYSLG